MERDDMEAFEGWMPDVAKRFMIVIRMAPRETRHGPEYLELALAAAAFDQEVSVLFLDDGVDQLVGRQDSGSDSLEDHSSAYGALEEYGVENVFVDGESLAVRGLGAGDLVIPVMTVGSDRLAEIMSRQDVIVGS